ncbi:hypothetical protein ACFLVB_00125 [Chloroflexota bacterium]
MDTEIKKEFDRVNEKLSGLDTKLDKTTRDGNILTFAVVGFSIFMVGIAVWFQQGMWTSMGNFLVIYGVLIVVSMYFMQKQILRRNVRWYVGVAAIVLLVVLEVIKIVT